MNAIGNPFQQLVDRKLWPIALLLVIALVAVPFVLKSDDGAGDPLPTPTAAVPAGAGIADSIVTSDDPAARDHVRAVLGDRKDPFRPAQIHRVKKAPDALAARSGQPTSVKTGASGGTDASSAGGSDASSGGGSSPPSGDSTTTPPSTGTTPAPGTPAPGPPAPGPPSPPAPPLETFEIYSLDVRFGSTSGELRTRNVKRLTGLPGGARPAILYLGLTGDRKGAVFAVAATVETLGDGKCDPSPDSCQTIVLKPGETEFFTRGKQQWELDLVKIHKDKTTDARHAAKARKATAAGGRRKLRGMLDRVGRYRYDERSGTLKKAPRVKRSAVTSRFTSG